MNTGTAPCDDCGAKPGNDHTMACSRVPRTTNFGPWAEWIEKIPKRDRAKIFALAERMLPSLVNKDHTRFDHIMDDAAISSALRIAQRFYARIGMFGSKPLKRS